jgi:hypothetical protein
VLLAVASAFAAGNLCPSLLRLGRDAAFDPSPRITEPQPDDPASVLADLSGLIRIWKDQRDALQKSLRETEIQIGHCTASGLGAEAGVLQPLLERRSRLQADLLRLRRDVLRADRAYVDLEQQIRTRRAGTPAPGDGDEEALIRAREAAAVLRLGLPEP